MSDIQPVSTFTLVSGTGRMRREDFDAIAPYVRGKFGKLQNAAISREINRVMLTGDETSKKIRSKMVEKARKMEDVDNYYLRKLAYQGQSSREARRTYREVQNEHIELFAYVLRSGVMVDVIREISQTTGQNPMDWRNIYTVISGRVNLGTAMRSVIEALQEAEKDVVGVREGIIAQRKKVLAFIGNVVSIGVSIGVPAPAGVIIGTVIRGVLSGNEMDEIVGSAAASYFETGAKGLAKDESISVDGYNPIEPKWLNAPVEGAAKTLGGYLPGEKFRKGIYEWVVTPAKSFENSKVASVSSQMQGMIEMAINAVDAFHKGAFDSLRSFEGVAPIAMACYSRFKPYLLRRIVREYELMGSLSQARAREIFKEELAAMVRGFILQLADNTAAEMQKCRSNLEACPLGKEKANMKKQFVKVLYGLALRDNKYLKTYAHPTKSTRVTIRNQRFTIRHETLAIDKRTVGLKNEYYRHMLNNGILMETDESAVKYSWRPSPRRPVPVESHWRGRVSPGDRAKYRIANWSYAFETELNRMMAGAEGLNNLINFLDSQYVIPRA